MDIVTDELIEVIDKAVEKIPTVYDDGLKQATQESGKIFALLPRTINAALVPLRKWIAEREYNLAETEKILAKKLEKVGEEKIITPEPYVAVPAIQAISYTMNSKELRDLYANLLAKAMNSDTKDMVHPAYLETIKQLSPEEAMYFKYICSLKIRPMVDVQLDLPEGLSVTISTNANLFSADYNKFFELTIDNLTRLGLINIPYGVWYGEVSVYETLIGELKRKFNLDQWKEKYPEATGISFPKKRIDLTAYGINFYETCIR